MSRLSSHSFCFQTTFVYPDQISAFHIGYPAEDIETTCEIKGFLVGLEADKNILLVK